MLGGCYVAESISKPMHRRACPGAAQEVCDGLGSIFCKRTRPIQGIVVTQKSLPDEKKLLNAWLISRLGNLLVQVSNCDGAVRRNE